MIDLKIELRVLVDCFFCNMMVWLPYTAGYNVEIIIVSTWLRSLLCSGNSIIKNHLEVSGLLESRDLL